MRKLEQAGYLALVTTQEAKQPTESWYITHHIVTHNKYRIVSNCSFQYNNQSLKEPLFPGPALGPSLLGVQLRFCQHFITVRGNIICMFYQIRLLLSDKPMLQFL